MAITKQQITEALHCGVRTASKNYDKWSGGPPFAKLPEHLIVVEIARNIHKKLGEHEYLRLEMQYTDVLDGAGVQSSRGAPLQAIKGGKRADVILLKNKVEPTCVIEVKKMPPYKGLLSDLERLRDVVYACRHQKGVLKHGFLSIYQSGGKKGVDQTTSRIQDFIEKCDRAHMKPPNVRFWKREQKASIVVEVTPANSN